mgnify:CR=1 FL=1
MQHVLKDFGGPGGACVDTGQKLQIQKQDLRGQDAYGVHHHGLPTEGVGLGKDAAGLDIAQNAFVAQKVGGFNIDAAA